MDVESPVGTLRTTLGAARAVNKRFGSYVDALQRVQAMDLEAYIFIVAVGRDKRPLDVEDDVYNTGLSDLVSPLVDYVSLLYTGGKPAKPAKEGDGAGE